MRLYGRFSLSVLCLLFISAAGCVTLPVTGVLPDSARVTELARVDADSPFALDAGGEAVAFVKDGLRLKELVSGGERLVSSDVPTALAWSPDGRQLAAAFSIEQETTLRLYDRQGNVLAKSRLAGRVNSLAWRQSSEILVFVVKQRVYRFGTHLAQLLYRWDGKNEPIPTPLHETTVMPAFMQQWEDVLYRTLTFSISPLDDEIVYARLYAPPAFAPYLKLTLRHLESGTEREIADISILSAGGLFFGDGVRLVWGDGERETQLFDPWGDRTIFTLPHPGRTLALSPSGRYLLLDGRLYRDGREIVSFPPESLGAFASRGGRLALRYGGRLYLVTNLPEEPAVPLDPATVERLRQLHKWRSEGLISAQDYLKAVERKAQ